MELIIGLSYILAMCSYVLVCLLGLLFLIFGLLQYITLDNSKIYSRVLKKLYWFPHFCFGLALLSSALYMSGSWQLLSSQSSECHFFGTMYFLLSFVIFVSSVNAYKLYSKKHKRLFIRVLYEKTKNEEKEKSDNRMSLPVLLIIVSLCWMFSLFGAISMVSIEVFIVLCMIGTAMLFFSVARFVKMYRENEKFLKQQDVC